MGSDIDLYLAESYQMRLLISSGGTECSRNQYVIFSPAEDPESPRALLLFKDCFTLCGYAIGVPENLGDGTWRFAITLCDYNFSGLYERQARDFAAAAPFPYIDPEDIKDCGATYYLCSSNSGMNDAERREIQQMYQLWNQYTSPYLERHCRDMERFDEKLPQGTSGSPNWRSYLFLDRDLQVIGYTILSSDETAG